jgi:hypothetical protein
MHTVYIVHKGEIYILYFPIHIHISEHRSSEYIQLQCPELVASYNLEITHWDSIYILCLKKVATLAVSRQLLIIK